MSIDNALARIKQHMEHPVERPPDTPERRKALQQYSESLKSAIDSHPAMLRQKAKDQHAAQLTALLQGQKVEIVETQAQIQAIGQTLAAAGVKQAAMQEPTTPHTPYNKQASNEAMISRMQNYQPPERSMSR